MAKQEEPFASVVLANRITNFREEEFIMASVSLQHIYKVYAGGVTAVSDFNLDIKDKQGWCILQTENDQKEVSSHE